MGVSFGKSFHPISTILNSPTPAAQRDPNLPRPKSPKPFLPRTMAAAVAGDEPTRLSGEEISNLLWGRRLLGAGWFYAQHWLNPDTDTPLGAEEGV
jgi:hypothetical protein